MRRHNLKKLHIWTGAMNLIDDNYAITSEFPDYEKFGLQTQMNRCAVLIASNIAQGTSKKKNKHFFII